MYIFCYLSSSKLYFVRNSYFNKKLRNRKFQFWWLRHKVWCWEFLTNSVNFDSICFVILEKKPFLSGVIVSVNRRRKSIKVTLVSFGLQTGRLTVECIDYRTRYFVTLTFFIRFKCCFGFKDCKVLAVSQRLAASHLRCQFWFG